MCSDNKKKYIEEFIQGIDKGPFKCLKEKKQEEQTSEYVSKKNGDSCIYDCAVDQAWLDVCRTAIGVDKNAVKGIIPDKLKIYFVEKPDNFDEWHETTCINIKKEVSGLTYGQIQKIVNMAFKYLYCCTDFYSDKKEFFEKCHMPLDSYTLKWCKEKGKELRYKESAFQWDGIKWSKIDDYKYYIKIQEGCRKILENQNVLEEEFRIWQKMKDEQELKDFKAFTKRIMRRLEKQNTPEGEMELIKKSLEIMERAYKYS